MGEVAVIARRRDNRNRRQLAIAVGDIERQQARSCERLEGRPYAHSYTGWNAVDLDALDANIDVPRATAYMPAARSSAATPTRTERAEGSQAATPRAGTTEPERSRAPGTRERPSAATRRTSPGATPFLPLACVHPERSANQQRRVGMRPLGSPGDLEPPRAHRRFDRAFQLLVEDADDKPAIARDDLVQQMVQEASLRPSGA